MSIRRTWALAITKFFTAFNDNAFKTVVMFVAMGVIARRASSEAEAQGQQAALVAFGSMVFMLPFVTFPSVTGWLADRFSKRRILVAAKVAEIFVMGFGLISFLLIGRFGFFPLLASVFLMSLQSTFFSPAFFGILPETFDEKDLSSANGVIELLNFMGMILGGACGALTEFIPPAYFENPSAKISILIGVPFIGIAVIGVLTSLFITETNAQKSHDLFGIRLVLDYFRNFKYIVVSRPIWLCIAGQAFFFAVGNLIMTSLLNFGVNDLGVSQMQTSMLVVAVAIGIGLGSYIAGNFSNETVEFGLVPIGVLGMLVFFVNLVLTHSYHHALVSCFALGFFGGFFFLPLKVYVQQKTPPGVRGKTLAQSNALSFWGMLLVSVIMLLVTGGVPGEVAADADFWTRVRGNFMTFNMRQLYTGSAIFLALVSAYVFWLLPDFLFRMLLVLLTRIVYSIRVFGRKNLPATGPALLIANHVSFVDGLLIGASCSRDVHFIIDEKYFKLRWVRPFARWLKLVPVPDPSSAGQAAALKGAIQRGREILAAGDVLCIFPEGRLTNNGKMRDFKRGYLKMIPVGMNVPIIPVHLGMVWGSMFSRFYGNIRPRLPRRLPYPVTISFGPPLTSDVSPWQARQAITELSSDAAFHAAPGECVFPERFIRTAHRLPFRKRFADTTGAELSSMQLLTRAWVMAAIIREDAGADEDYVGLLLPNSVAGAAMCLAVMLTDRIPVFLNYATGDDALDLATKACGIRRIYTSRAFMEKVRLRKRENLIYLEDLLPRIGNGRKLCAMLRACLPAALARRWYFPKTAADLHNTATVLFSSGSTGTPKGVVLTHHNFNANCNAVMRALALDQQNVVMGVLPFFHSFGFLATLWAPLSWGVRVVWHPNPLDAETIGKTIARYKADMLFAAPTFLRAYMRKCRPQDLQSLRLLVAGAEKLTPEIATAFHENFGVLPVEGYGCTELSPVVSINLPEDLREIGRSMGRPGSIGQPIPGVAAKTVDPLTMTDLEEGEEGILMIRGASVMKEYLHDPQRTADAMHQGWYNTGDMARIDRDGYMYITGRLSRFSKIGGEMVPHMVIEEELHKTVNTVDQRFVVTGLAHKSRGEQLIVFHVGLDQTPTEIVAKLRERGLPNLWIPKPTAFHRIDEIPYLASGKLDLHRINELAADLKDGDPR